MCYVMMWFIWWRYTITIELGLSSLFELCFYQPRFITFYNGSRSFCVGRWSSIPATEFKSCDRCTPSDLCRIFNPALTACQILRRRSSDAWVRILCCCSEWGNEYFFEHEEGAFACVEELRARVCDDVAGIHIF